MKEVPKPLAREPFVCWYVSGIRTIKFCEKRFSALNLVSVQISNFKYSTGLSTVQGAIYHNHMNIMEQASTNVLMRLMKH